VTNITLIVVLVVHCRNSEVSGIPPYEQIRCHRILQEQGLFLASTPIWTFRVIVPPEAARDFQRPPSFIHQSRIQI
jgi:hypothetical protein